jgi:hypothetical protein
MLRSIVFQRETSDDPRLRHVDPLQRHLQLSASHYQESRWDDSIASSRKVLEGVLRQVAGRYGRDFPQKALSSDALSRPVAARDYLQQVGLLEKKEKEAVAQVYGLLRISVIVISLIGAS